MENHLSTAIAVMGPVETRILVPRQENISMVAPRHENGSTMVFLKVRSCTGSFCNNRMKTNEVCKIE